MDNSPSDFPTSVDVLKDISENSKRHIKKHLPRFQQLDSAMTEQLLLELGAKIVSPKNLIGSPNAEQLKFEKVVNLNENLVRVRVVLNRNHKLRSIHIRDK
ncbi:MAG: hypothetical protein AAFQ80_20385 [Cyanobacteria bacterium J06621_8]